MTEIEDVEEQESEHLQQYLAAHLKNPAFHYCHHWTAGDPIWDNCSAHPLAIFDYGALPHRMHRAGVMGPAPT